MAAVPVLWIGKGKDFRTVIPLALLWPIRRRNQVVAPQIPLVAGILLRVGQLLTPSATPGILITQSGRAQRVDAVFYSTTNLTQSAQLHIVRGEGIHVFDNRGWRYLEGLAGLWCAAPSFGA